MLHAQLLHNSYYTYNFFYAEVQALLGVTLMTVVVHHIVLLVQPMARNHRKKKLMKFVLYFWRFLDLQTDLVGYCHKFDAYFSLLHVCVFLERVLQDGLYYEFCRYSPKAVVKMYGNTPEKLFAVVKYSRSVSTYKLINYTLHIQCFIWKMGVGGEDSHVKAACQNIDNYIMIYYSNYCTRM